MTNNKTIGIILSAGFQTRFDSIMPKTLMMYDDHQTILEKNIDTMLNFCDIIYVVINVKSLSESYEFIVNKYIGVKLISINSGLGDGHAVLQSLRYINRISTFLPNDRVFLVWGDSIQDEKSLFKSTLNSYNESFTLPVKYESDPYVQFIITDTYINGVKFKRYNDDVSSGYHDYSLFLFNPITMLVVLTLHDENNWNNEDKMYTCRNNELVFLDIVNDYNSMLHPSVVIIDESGNTSINAFNTYEEYKKLINRGLEK